jgi:hypothetical protein
LTVTERRHFQKLAGQQKIVVRPHFPLDFPGKGSIAVGVDGPFWVATAWLRAPKPFWRPVIFAAATQMP